MNKNIIALGFAVISAISTQGYRAPEINTGNTYNNCVNPSQFWNAGMDENKYKNIYLHYCARLGEGNSQEIVVVHHNNSHSATSVNTNNNVPTPKPPVVIVTKTPEPKSTEEPKTDDNKDKVCKNKNDNKDNKLGDCNAGGGNDTK